MPGVQTYIVLGVVKWGEEWQSLEKAISELCENIEDEAIAAVHQPHNSKPSLLQEPRCRRKKQQDGTNGPRTEAVPALSGAERRERTILEDLENLVQDSAPPMPRFPGMDEHRIKMQHQM